MAIRSLSGPPGDRAMLRIAGETDCQKVNCPEGAREATLGCVGLCPPRNDSGSLGLVFLIGLGRRRLYIQINSAISRTSRSVSSQPMQGSVMDLP